MASNTAASPSPRRSTFGGLDVMSMTVDPSAYCMEAGQRVACSAEAAARGMTAHNASASLQAMCCQARWASRMRTCIHQGTVLGFLKKSFGMLRPPAGRRPPQSPGPGAKSRPAAPRRPAATPTAGPPAGCWSTAAAAPAAPGRPAHLKERLGSGIEERHAGRQRHVRPALLPVSSGASVCIARPGDMQQGPAGEA
jgi:hypothetical protein